MFLFITLILTGFVIGTAYLQVTYGNGWFIAFIPLLIICSAWGFAMINEYSKHK